MLVRVTRLQTGKKIPRRVKRTHAGVPQCSGQQGVWARALRTVLGETEVLWLLVCEQVQTAGTFEWTPRKGTREWSRHLVSSPLCLSSLSHCIWHKTLFILGAQHGLRQQIWKDFENYNVLYMKYHSLSFWFKLFFLLPSHKLSLSFAVQTYDIFFLIFSLLY